MFQTWGRLLFLHWKFDAEALAETLPPGLHVDLHEGNAWLGIVPFFMRKVRKRFLPAVPGISNFLELNVRTYVHDDNGVPGVWFHSLDTDSLIAQKYARRRYHLPYFMARMHAKVRDGTTRLICNRHGQQETAQYTYRESGRFAEAQPGSLEFFLLERYLLYAWNSKKESLSSGRVHHTPYQYAKAVVHDQSTLPARWDDIDLPDSKPDHACVAKDVDVDVFALKPHSSS